MCRFLINAGESLYFLCPSCLVWLDAPLLHVMEQQDRSQSQCRWHATRKVGCFGRTCTSFWTSEGMRRRRRCVRPIGGELCRSTPTRVGVRTVVEVMQHAVFDSLTLLSQVEYLCLAVRFMAQDLFQSVLNAFEVLSCRRVGNAADCHGSRVEYVGCQLLQLSRATLGGLEGCHGMCQDVSRAILHVGSCFATGARARPTMLPVVGDCYRKMRWMLLQALLRVSTVEHLAVPAGRGQGKASEA